VGSTSSTTTTPTTSSTTTTVQASLQVSASPNPAPFSGQPINTASCKGVPNTWFYQIQETNKNSVAITITRRVERLDNMIVNDFNPNRTIAPGQVFTEDAQWCSPSSGQHTVDMAYTAIDANKQPVVVNGPPTVTLRAKPVVVRTVSPNPVPFSGQPVNTANCKGVPNTWFYDDRLTNNTTVTVTITRIVDVFDERVANDLSVSLPISPGATRTFNYQWCSTFAGQHIVDTTYTITAGGAGVPVEGVAEVTLLPQVGSEARWRRWLWPLMVLEPTRRGMDGAWWLMSAATGGRERAGAK
jgi:hypothetical protein